MNHFFTFENKSSLFGKCGSMTIRYLIEAFTIW